MKILYIICSIITLVFFVWCLWKDYRKNGVLRIAVDDVMFLAALMLCGYYGTFIVAVVEFIEHFEFCKKNLFYFRKKDDETLESDRQEGRE